MVPTQATDIANQFLEVYTDSHQSFQHSDTT